MSTSRKTPKVYKARAWVTDEHGGVWMITADAVHVQQLPGGTVKKDENLKAAIIREVREETGFAKVTVTARTKPVKTRRGGVTEVTTCFHVVVSGKRRKPALTRRERARGLTATRYANARKALKALERRLAAHGRSAVRRDLLLTRTILAA